MHLSKLSQLCTSDLFNLLYVNHTSILKSEFESNHASISNYQFTGKTRDRGACYPTPQGHISYIQNMRNSTNANDLQEINGQKKIRKGEGLTD